jgi:hypothetical protein
MAMRAPETPVVEAVKPSMGVLNLAAELLALRKGRMEPVSVTINTVCEVKSDKYKLPAESTSMLLIVPRVAIEAKPPLPSIVLLA